MRSRLMFLIVGAFVGLVACVGDAAEPPACANVLGNYKLTNACVGTVNEACAATQSGCVATFTCPSGALNATVTADGFSFTPGAGVTCTATLSASKSTFAGSCGGTKPCTFSGQKL